MKNVEIANANAALGELVNEKIKGKLKFKLFKLKSELEENMAVIQKSLEGVESNSKEYQEILDEEQDIMSPLLLEEELEELPLSMKQVSLLQPIIKKEKDDK